jgi:hypothetical protein
VPAKLFWSVTVYDPDTGSEIVTDQGTAAIRSLQELQGLGDAKSVDLFFGSKLPSGVDKRRWVQRCRIRAGSPTSASTAGRELRLTATGSPAISRK